MGTGYRQCKNGWVVAKCYNPPVSTRGKDEPHFNYLSSKPPEHDSLGKSCLTFGKGAPSGKLRVRS
jgi:hypothetical protein